MDEFVIHYSEYDNYGSLRKVSETSQSIWSRLSSSAINIDIDALKGTSEIKLPWYQMLLLLREFIPLQRSLKFRIKVDDSAKRLLNKFLADSKASQAVASNSAQLSSEQVEQQLISLGFDPNKRKLKDFQKRDIAILAGLPNGANFSVPGAGKTTVALAVHALTCEASDKMLVICPKSAFPAWSGILNECINPDAGSLYGAGKFINLSGLDDRSLNDFFTSNYRYFFTNYEHFVGKKDVFLFLLATNSVHLVLDESHRMKAGEASLRGAALLSVANLPKRKDILSGTPMPQAPSDLQAQIDFLWPGSVLGTRILRGEAPALVIGGLYARTTKKELCLPKAVRKFISVNMSTPQAILYGIVRSETLSQLTSLRNGSGFDIIRARRSVMRLLQLASNPLLAVRSMANEITIDEALINSIIEQPVSPKMLEACRLVRQNVEKNRKTVIWTIFTQNIKDLETMLADFNPVSIYGDIKTGLSEDFSTREGRLNKFHTDNSCMVLIANPAAAGEGISLHTVCHEAIYLDRSYVSTHYLQSIDRIHRLGLQPGTVTNINIIVAAAPVGLGSIDFSVSRRLAKKIRALEQLLQDPDLHEVALDEENAIDPIDYSLDVDDIADLINELEGRISFDDQDVV